MSVAVRTAPPPRGLSLRALAAEQAGVAGAQLAAGLGNAAFAVIVARILAPGGFAEVAAFLALYLLVHVPAASLSAGSALDDDLARRARRRALTAGGALALVVAVAGVPLAPLVGLAPSLALVLAAGIPAAMPLALERGRLFGTRSHARAAASLLVEPAVRLAAGVPLAIAGGAAGAAAAVVLGGWAALAVASNGPRIRAPEAASAPRPTTPAIAAFLGLALIQNQDVLLSNARLGDDGAGAFAALSTLGGVAAFATTTVPLVLLPRARGGARGALAMALGAAGALGLAAVAVVGLAPGDIIAAGFGERFRHVAGLAVPYVAAMALLGAARVLVADRCARGAGWGLAAAVGAVAAVQAAAILAVGHSPGAIAMSTLAATVVLLGVSAGAVALPRPVRIPRPSLAALRAQLLSGAFPAVMGLTVVALGVRLLATRGLWLDEATSVTQAQMTFGDMLHSLRTTDVHPPLHHAVLWATVHLSGSTQELVVRAPSIVAGTLLVPALWATGRELWGPRAGLAAAALGVVAPFAVWYAQEARMYAFFMLFATLALLAQLRALRTDRARDWVFLALACAALVWTQYFASLVVAVVQTGVAAALWRSHRAGEPIGGRLLGWAGSLLLLAVLVLPLVHFAEAQFAANEAAGRGFDQSPSQAGGDVSSARSGPGVYSALTNLIWAVWGYHSNATMAALTALWPALMLLALLLLGRGRPRGSGRVAALALVPAAGMTLIGFAKPFLFEARYFIALTPMALLLLARATTGWTASKTGAVLATSVVAATLALGTADQQLNRSNPRLYDFGGAMSEIRQRAKPGDVVLYEPDYLGDLVRYLHPGVDARPLAKGVPKPDGHRHQVFVLASFLDLRQHAAATGRGIHALERGRDLEDRFRKPQVEVWQFR